MTQQLPDFVERLIQWPTVPAWVAEREGQRFRLAWEPTAVSAQIYLLNQPDSFDDAVLLTPVQAAQSAWVETTAVRPYFGLVFQGGERDGQRLIVAERILPLAGVPNFRDIGGYVGKNGRLTRWGKIYRSGDLFEAETADLDLLTTLGLQNICDLRTAGEVATRPDQLPQPNPSWVNVSINSRAPRWKQVIDVIRYRKRLQQLVINGYVDIFLEENAAIVGLMLSQLADTTSMPLLIHCTAGKDRTGLSIALLLSILGVSDEVILADYSLSNYAHATFHRILRKDVERLVRFGFEPQALEAFFMTDPFVLQTALTHLREKYGSVEHYLRQQAAISPATLAQIQANLLIAPD